MEKFERSLPFSLHGSPCDARRWYVVVRGRIPCHFIVPLAILRGHMTSKTYLSILQDHLNPVNLMMQTTFQGVCPRFHVDNAKVHTPNYTRLTAPQSQAQLTGRGKGIFLATTVSVPQYN